MTSTRNLAYQILNVAFEHYGCATAELSSEQQQEAARIAKRKLHIEEAVLSSDEAAKVSIPSSSIDEAFLKIRERYEDPHQFSQELDSLEIDQRALKASLERELRVESILDYVAAEEKAVTETDANLYYYMNPDKFIQPEIRTARHILVTINDENPENTRPVAFERISQVRKRLIKKPDRFEEQALKHSECPTALEGGLLGKVKAGVLYKELEEVLFKMTLGEVSDVIESPIGFHILRCDEIQSEGKLPFVEVSEKLVDHLTLQNRKRAQKKWIAEQLQKNSRPDNVKELVNE